MIGSAYSVNAGQVSRMLGRWRRQGPAYIDLAGTLRMLIRDGRLPPETRLPAERSLAGQCGISRNTVAAAYAVLRDQGYLCSHRGSGSFTALPEADTSTGREVSWVPPAAAAVDMLDLATAVVAAPEPELSEAVGEIRAEVARHAEHSGYDLIGLPPLRQAIAERYVSRGLPTTPDQIMVTNGAHNAWGLLLRLLARHHDRILVDSPTYPNALDAIRACGCRPLPIGLSADGWDVDLVKATLRQTSPRVTYLMPDFHNPTGRTMPAGARRAIVGAARRADTHVVVDETMSELSLDGTAKQPPMAAYGSADHVISVGSLSKTCWGGLRMGWIRAAPPLLARLTTLRGAIDGGNPIVPQLIACRLFQQYEALLGARRSALVERRRAIVDAIRHELPEWRFTVPRGGLTLWVDLGASISTQLSMVAARHGVRVLAGSRFGIDGTLDSFMRLPYVREAAVLRTAVHRLALAHADVVGATGSDPRDDSRATRVR